MANFETAALATEAGHSMQISALNLIVAAQQARAASSRPPVEQANTTIRTPGRAENASPTAQEFQPLAFQASEAESFPPATAHPQSAVLLPPGSQIDIRI